MKGITRDDFLKVWKWEPEDAKDCDFAIFRKDGTVYDVYEDKQTAFRVLVDLISRYGEDRFEVVEVF